MCEGSCRRFCWLVVDPFFPDKPRAMGGKNTKPLPKKEVLALCEETYFDAGTVQRMHGAFKYISASVKDDGIIDPEEFQLAIGFNSLTFCRRIFQLVDGDGDMRINFREFVKSVSTLVSIKEVPEEQRDDLIEEKLKFSFQVYDEDQDNRISREELSGALRDVMESREIAVEDEHIECIVNATFDQAATEHADYITYDEYKRLITNNVRSFERFLQAYSVDVDAALQNAAAMNRMRSRSKGKNR